MWHTGRCLEPLVVYELYCKLIRDSLDALLVVTCVSLDIGGRFLPLYCPRGSVPCLGGSDDRITLSVWSFTICTAKGLISPVTRALGGPVSSYKSGNFHFSQSAASCDALTCCSQLPAKFPAYVKPIGPPSTLVTGHISSSAVQIVNVYTETVPQRPVPLSSDPTRRGTQPRGKSNLGPGPKHPIIHR